MATAPMDLKSGYPWWAVENGLLHAFPALAEDVRCDVAVIGGGVTGALVADELAAHGHEVVVVEHRDVGWGSTAASTALLQYEIDEHMTELAERYGEDDAALAYRSCVEAIEQLAGLAREVRDVAFARCDSLYYASRPGDVPALRAELELRQKHLVPTSWLGPEQIFERYQLEAPGALITSAAARIDPYRLTYRLLARLERRGGGIFDRTTVEKIEPAGRAVTLTTHRGFHVRAAHVVMAAGYASQQWLTARLRRKVAKNRSSYAFITDPISAEELGPLTHTMLWESARPYLYLRTTGEGRVLIGGEDDEIDVPARRDARVEKKSRRLMQRAQQLLPHLQLTPAFAWAGTFAETEDGLPFFGAHPSWGPRVQFAMAYGGNGIVYSALGAGLLRAAIERRRHPLAELFSFRRLER